MSNQQQQQIPSTGLVRRVFWGDDALNLGGSAISFALFGDKNPGVLAKIVQREQSGGFKNGTVSSYMFSLEEAGMVSNALRNASVALANKADYKWVATRTKKDGTVVKFIVSVKDDTAVIVIEINGSGAVFMFAQDSKFVDYEETGHITTPTDVRAVDMNVIADSIADVTVGRNIAANKHLAVSYGAPTNKQVANSNTGEDEFPY